MDDLDNVTLLENLSFLSDLSPTSDSQITIRVCLSLSFGFRPFSLLIPYLDGSFRQFRTTFPLFSMCYEISRIYFVSSPLRMSIAYILAAVKEVLGRVVDLRFKNRFRRNCIIRSETFILFSVTVSSINLNSFRMRRY